MSFKANTQEELKQLNIQDGNEYLVEYKTKTILMVKRQLSEQKQKL